MPQMLLPVFSKDVTLINSLIGYAKRDGWVYYFNGQMPLFSHKEDDMNTFKMFMAQLYVTGNATQAEINRTFGLKNPMNMKRWAKKYKEGGPAAFYKQETNRKPRVMTEQVLQNIQSILDTGQTPPEIAKELGLKADTLNKAIREGKLHRQSFEKKTKPQVAKAKEA